MIIWILQYIDKRVPDAKILKCMRKYRLAQNLKIQLVWYGKTSPVGQDTVGGYFELKCNDKYFCLRHNSEWRTVQYLYIINFIK